MIMIGTRKTDRTTSAPKEKTMSNSLCIKNPELLCGSVDRGPSQAWLHDDAHDGIFMKTPSADDANSPGGNPGMGVE
jgi:hypothetical protein